MEIHPFGPRAYSAAACVVSHNCLQEAGRQSATALCSKGKAKHPGGVSILTGLSRIYDRSSMTIYCYSWRSRHLLRELAISHSCVSVVGGQLLSRIRSGTLQRSPGEMVLNGRYSKFVSLSSDSESRRTVDVVTLLRVTATFPGYMTLENLFASSNCWKWQETIPERLSHRRVSFRGWFIWSLILLDNLPQPQLR